MDQDNNQNDSVGKYSFNVFESMPQAEKEKYIELARQRWPSLKASRLVIGIAAANIWMEEMLKKDEKNEEPH